MSKLRSRLTSLLNIADDRFDSLASRLRIRLNADKPLQIVTFRSYGTTKRLYVAGRVLKDKQILKATGKESTWNNIISMYKRFESDEVPGARLKLTFAGQEHVITTDHEGYFKHDLMTETPLTWRDMWHEVDIELIDAPYYSWSAGLKATAHVLVPPADAEYGIISDIDDTIVKTTATSLLAMSKNTFLHNAHSRLPFAGVGEFYKSLQLGRNGKRNNPFFYVSSSPWNLYDLLIDFLDINDIPEGPLLLRDFGLDPKKESSSHMGHKFRQITDIMLTYPHLQFVLIGDSGQEDPKIYKEIVKKFPDRVLAIYIRDVQLADREKIAIDISESLRADKVQMLVVDNTIEAAEHAAASKLIFTEEIPKIVSDKKQDKGEAPGKEKIE
jgi:phosphatidate phosphatase APP1